MIPVSILVSGIGTTSSLIRGGHGKRLGEIPRPVIAWNITARCNLRCIHCYIDAGPQGYKGVSREDALKILDQIIELGSPMIIFSGGEPLARKDLLLELASRAVDRGIKTVLSTNGTMIDRDIAKRIAEAGLSYVGISLDSTKAEWHDMFRGVRGSFEKALRGARLVAEEGVHVGFRYTLTRYNIDEALNLVDLALEVGAKRITYYHLSYVGRALKLPLEWLPSPTQYFGFMDTLIDVVRRLAGKVEFETTMAPFDGIYIALKTSSNPEDLFKKLEIVRGSGGCGRKILSIYPDGSVHPCQFVDFIELGNALREKLSTIVSRSLNSSLKPFIEPWNYVKKGRCSLCPFLRWCGGGDRVRAYYLGGSLDESDPYCPLHLTDHQSIKVSYKIPDHNHQA
ncbi:MAG: radical SAM protein [Desulfurococcales archaeon]|jgi:radical SAM protein with 4Fe4S-binding SPASM domain|nr:radical SAM protein [Desulfurococcales archaeon]